MALKILLDSVVLIDHFNGVEPATSYLRQEHGEAAISVITRAEVLCGFEEGERKVASRVLDRFPVLPIGVEAADLAARFRHERKWRLPDALQAALAYLHGLKLATRNTRDFPPDRFDFVIVPYKLPRH